MSHFFSIVSIQHTHTVYTVSSEYTAHTHNILSLVSIQHILSQVSISPPEASVMVDELCADINWYFPA